MNFPTACPRVLKIGGIQDKENKSLKAQYILKSIRTETLDEYNKGNTSILSLSQADGSWNRHILSVSFSMFISVSYFFRLKGFDIQ